ncbi:MAG TPA: hypothetical protein VK731_01165, partial [Candidatus Cybelea sp.]|nr:hypothetical protein [Candidatus Cybelea sp.]
MSTTSLLRNLQTCAIIAVALACGSISNARADNPYSSWSNGPSASPDYFPIAVWLQEPANAPRFQAAGFNLYVGLWEGPTQAQLDTLAKTGIRVICDQNKIGLQNLTNPVIAGWMQGDEPDNAQWAGRYGPPMSTDKVHRHYDEMRAADPSRPVLLNLGQGVAWDNYIGRGTRRNHPEDYADYVKGCDIASFDIYPVVHDDPAVAGKLEFVANGVQRLVAWNAGKLVWNCIECTHINNPNAKATPAQVRAEVWMSLIHGSRGLIYFVHQFKPVFREPALLDDAEMLAAVTAINRQIRELAPVLNTPTVTNAVAVHSSVPVATMVKQRDGATYLFAACMRNQPAQASFTKITGLAPHSSAEVLGESRTIPVTDAAFTDD